MEPQFADTKVRSKDDKKSRYNHFFLMFSVHRKQPPYVVVGSFRGMRGSRIFCQGGGVQARLPENSSDNFFSPQHYRGCPMVISNITIIFNIFRRGGGPNANFYRNPYNL